MPGEKEMLSGPSLLTRLPVTPWDFYRRFALWGLASDLHSECVFVFLKRLWGKQKDVCLWQAGFKRSYLLFLEVEQWVGQQTKIISS